MIARRAFVSAAALAGAWPALALAQQKMPRIALLERTSAVKYQAAEKPFVETLRKLGWIEGHNIVYDRAFADDDIKRLPGLFTELLARKPDVIYTTVGDASQIAVAATKTIPIVVGSQSDIVERGWVKSLANPGGNVTGILNVGPDLGPKRLQFLRLALPKVTKVGVFFYPAGSQTVRELKAIEESAKELQLTIVPASAALPVDIEKGMAVFAKNRVGAVLTTHSTFFQIEAPYLVALTAFHHIPLVAHRAEMTQDGALLAYSSVLAEQYQRAAVIVDKILRGAKPAEIPVEQPTKFELAINRRAARMLNIAIPQSVLVQATKVVE